MPRAFTLVGRLFVVRESNETKRIRKTSIHIMKPSQLEAYFVFSSTKKKPISIARRVNHAEGNWRAEIHTKKALCRVINISPLLCSFIPSRTV